MADDFPKKLASIQNPKRLTGKWIFTILWCAISFAILFWNRDSVFAVAGVLLSLLGIGMLFGVIRANLEYLKYRQVRLVVARLPETGGRLEAMLDLPAAAPPDGQLVAELACVELMWSQDEEGKEALGEWDVWKGRQALRVLRGPITSQAALAINIPPDRPASSLPGEGFPDTYFRPSSSSGSRILGRAYYRWELRIRANAPGMDLERTYPLQVVAGRTVAPAPADAAPAARRTLPKLDGSFVALALGQLWTRFASPSLRGTIGLGIAGLICAAYMAFHLYNAGKLHLGPLEAPLRAALGRPQLDMRVAGFEIQPENPTYVGIGARGISAEQHGDELRVRVREIRLEKVRGRHPAHYMQIGGVLYRAGDWPSQSYGYAWHALQGVLTPDEPGVTLRDQIFSFRMALSRCADGGCEVRLLVVTQDDMGGPRRDHSLPAKLANIVAGAPAGAGPRSRQTWAENYAGAMEAFSGGRDADAERLLGETLALIEKHHGAGHPAAARVHYQLSLLYERRKQPAEQEKALVAAREILFNLPDKVVKKDLAPDASIDLEIITRRLADFYREQRRYTDAAVHYRRAKDYLSRIETPEPERNQRLARNAAGLMATACAQWNWGEAEQAMTELKARLADVDAGTRQEIEQVIRAIEPRLAARKC